MAEERGPVYRASNRPAAWILLFVSLGASVVINSHGRPSVGTGIVGAVCLLENSVATSIATLRVLLGGGLSPEASPRTTPPRTQTIIGAP